MARVANESLTDRESLFARYYADTLNATKSCRMAGYDCATYGAFAVQANVLLKKANVKTEINRLLKQRKPMQPEEVLERYTTLAQGDLGDFAGIQTLDDLAKHPKSFVVKKLKIKRWVDKNSIEFIETEIEIHDPNRSLDSLARFYNMVNDPGSDNKPFVIKVKYDNPDPT